MGSAYHDSRGCSYCGNIIDPLQLCGCPRSVADFVNRRMSGMDFVVDALNDAADRIKKLEAELAVFKQTNGKG